MSAKFTREEFERLPALVTRSEFIAWTGYGARELSRAIRAGEIPTHTPPGAGRAKYFKSVIGQLNGFTQ